MFIHLVVSSSIDFYISLGMIPRVMLRWSIFNVLLANRCAALFLFLLAYYRLTISKHWKSSLHSAMQFLISVGLSSKGSFKASITFFESPLTMIRLAPMAMDVWILNRAASHSVNSGEYMLLFFASYCEAFSFWISNHYPHTCLLFHCGNCTIKVHLHEISLWRCPSFAVIFLVLLSLC